MQRALSLTRAYSTQTSKLVRPPISLFGVAGSYTNAVYSAASKNQCLDAVEADLRKLDAAIQKDVMFREFLFNPLIKVTQKKDILKQVMTSKLQAMTENRRLKQLADVTKNFIKAMQVSRGELECTVTTAKPIADEATKKEIAASLKAFTSSKLTVNMAVDPAIIGGMIVDFDGEHYIDMSVRTKVKMYSDLIQQAV